MPRKKVKDMPRKQQMAVKASMAEQAAGKKSVAKMVSAKDNNAAIKENKKKKTKKIVKTVVKTLFTPTGGVTEKLVRKAKKSYKKYKANKARKDAVKKGVEGAIAGGVPKGNKRGLKDAMQERGLKVTKKLVKTKVSPRFKKPSEMTVYDYENDDRGMRTNPYKPDPSPGRLKASALKMKKSPALAKLSASCKAAARRKFKVYPSAYANMWASRTQKKGKC